MSKTKIAIRSAAKRYVFECPFVIPVATADGRKVKPKFIPIPNIQGYPVISTRMRKLDISMQMQVHQIVAYQKYGEEIFSEGIKCRHKDNDKLNFSHENILIGTALDNFMDNPESMRKRISETAILAGEARKVIAPDELLAMKSDRRAGMSFREISKKYGKKMTTLFGAIKGHTYLKENELEQPPRPVANGIVP